MERVNFKWADGTETVASVMSDIGPDNWKFSTEDSNLKRELCTQLQRQLNHHEAVGDFQSEIYKFQVEFPTGKKVLGLFVKVLDLSGGADFGAELLTDGWPKIVSATCLYDGVKEGV